METQYSTELTDRYDRYCRDADASAPECMLMWLRCPDAADTLGHTRDNLEREMTKLIADRDIDILIAQENNENPIPVSERYAEKARRLVRGYEQPIFVPEDY